MNVDSLRSNVEDGKESAEIRIAKVYLNVSVYTVGEGHTP
jgi:hypothetical protein